MEYICPNERCTGCYACHDACPVSCITFRPDNQGFIRPNIDRDSCIHCKKCQAVCPGLSPLYGKSEPRLFAARALSSACRTHGSSGGIFGVFASYVVEHDGVVFGAAFDSDLNLRHINAETKPQLVPLYKSKYIQSDLSDIYKSVKTFCTSGRLVLFCGTPCQCAALRKFLRKEYTNLLIIDFLCHGVPSQNLWRNCLDAWERKNKMKIIRFSFREKNKNLKRDHNFSLTALDSKGREHNIIGPSYKFPYYYNYTNYTLFRPSCYECLYAKPKRISDITLGDFWHLQQILDISSQDYRKGYSALMINTEKGETMFDKSKNQIWFKPLEIEILKKLNPTLTNSTSSTLITRQSLADLGRLSHEEIEKRYMTIHMDVISRMIRFLKRRIRL